MYVNCKHMNFYMKEPVVLISLPRTGTTSFCIMLQKLGYQTSHAPLMKYKELLKPGWGLGDTPMFAESIIQDVVSQPINAKLVYIDRNFDTWFNSMTRSTTLLQTHARLSKSQHIEYDGQDIDVKYYGEVFGFFEYARPDLKDYIRDKFYAHREMCLSHNPFIYSLENKDGWEPLCEYLGVEVPDGNIPHLHKVSGG